RICIRNYSGFRVYGLSEHCPRYRIQDLYPEGSYLLLLPQELNKTFTDYIID
ncbi:12323_t:CDS:1, partial [Entrophospora sp. SA101]